MKEERALEDEMRNRHRVAVENSHVVPYWVFNGALKETKCSTFRQLQNSGKKWRRNLPHLLLNLLSLLPTCTTFSSLFTIFPEISSGKTALVTWHPASERHEWRESFVSTVKETAVSPSHSHLLTWQLLSFFSIRLSTIRTTYSHNKNLTSIQ